MSKLEIKATCIVQMITEDLETNSRIYTLRPIRYTDNRSSLQRDIDICIKKGSPDDVYLENLFFKNQPVEMSFSGQIDEVENE